MKKRSGRSYTKRQDISSGQRGSGGIGQYIAHCVQRLMSCLDSCVDPINTKKIKNTTQKREGRSTRKKNQKKEKNRSTTKERRNV